jgi:hypothetical protein
MENTIHIIKHDVALRSRGYPGKMDIASPGKFTSPGARVISTSADKND